MVILFSTTKKLFCFSGEFTRTNEIEGQFANRISRAVLLSLALGTVTNLSDKRRRIAVLLLVGFHVLVFTSEKIANFIPR